MRLKSAGLLVLVCWLIGSSARGDTNFIAGADFSHLKYFESLGAHYRDGGVIQDAIQIIKNHGLNCVRLRLFTSSQTQAAANPYNYINNTNYTVPLAQRVKNAGLQLCLDFHYSDTWADPGHQTTPNAWTNLTFTQLVQTMRAYNSNTIVTFHNAGAMPDYVQIGNEITGGMLWPTGKLSGVWSSTNASWIRLGQLMSAAVQGIQDATNVTGAKMPKIIVHIDRGGDWGTTRSYFDNLNAQGVPYDIIGESYYTFFHGDPTNLNICLSNAAVYFGKPVVVAETAFPWNNSVVGWTNKLYGFPATTNGQISFIAAIAKMLQSVSNHLGIGIMYWGAEYQPGGGGSDYNNSSFWDYGGNRLPVTDAVGGTHAPLLIKNSFVIPASLQLQWPFSGAGSQLMTTTSLAPTTGWTPVPNPVQITGTVFTVTLPMGGGISSSRFYRLQSN
jgi:arabinogalactan endo-1,4-beta-galactosidase